MTRTTMLCALASFVALSACSKDDPKKDEGASSTKPVASAKAAVNSKPIELTEVLDVGAAADEGDTRYAGIKVKAPAGARMEGGAWMTLKYNDKGYEIRFQFDGEDYVQKAKTGAKENEQLNPIVKFHVDTADAILWETSSKLVPDGPHNFLFAARVKVGDGHIVCKNEGYGRFDRVEADALMKSCQSATKD